MSEPKPKIKRPRIDLPTDLHAALVALATAGRRSLQQHIIAVLEQHVRDQRPPPRT